MATYYSGAGDGYVYKQPPSDNMPDIWNDAHHAASGINSYSAETVIIRSYLEDLSGTGSLCDCLIYRGFFPIDTSGIGDGDTISAAVLKLYVAYRTDTEDDGDDWFNVVQTSQASTSALQNDDYIDCGAVNDPTEGATRVDATGITTSAYNNWTLDATGRGWIDKTGYTKLGLREGHDAIDSPLTTPTGGGIERVTITVASSEDTSGTKDPYLDVTAETITQGIYSRSKETSLPINDNDLSTSFSQADYTTVSTDDSQYVEQDGGL